MNGDFKTAADAVRYHIAEGFAVGHARCRSCFHDWSVFVHTDTCKTRLQCPRCAKTGNWFIGICVTPQ